MSRLGKKPVVLPKDVTTRLEGDTLVVKGPRGELRKRIPAGLAIAQASGQLTVQVSRDDAGSLQGTFRKLAGNMALGVSEGFKKVLQIEGVGFRAQAAGEKLSFQLGFSRPHEFVLPKGIKATVDPKQTLVTIEGNDKEMVGEVAAKIRGIKPPEPYKGTGVRYQNEQIRKKAGKAAAGAAGAGAAGGAKK